MGKFIEYALPINLIFEDAADFSCNMNYGERGQQFGKIKQPIFRESSKNTNKVNKTIKREL